MDDLDRGSQAPDDTPTLAMGVEIPGYRLIRRVGQGGMGVVFLADQEAPVHRRVAVKLILQGAGDRSVLARFERERQSLALMNHPNVAQVFDAGQTRDGTPYFVMEYVDGEPITAHCDRRRLPLRERIQLFRMLCDGVQHAHQRGILHRDLKPSNVLVTGASAVKVIDFGLARALEPAGDGGLLVTRVDQLVGTPAYMSPEQATPGTPDVDTRSDVYSLGVILFELLTGRLPYTDGDTGDPVEMFRRIREGIIVRPSALLAATPARAAEAAKRCALEPRALIRALKDDLDWIVIRALERDRARRYASASELSADLERHLRSQPIVAGPPSAGYRAAKFVARHRLGITAAGLIAAALIFAAVTSTVLLLHSRRAEAAARDEASKATTLYEFLVGVLHAPSPKVLGRDVKVIDALARAETGAAKSFAGRPQIEVGVRKMLAVTYNGLGIYDKAAEQQRLAIELLTATKGADDRETLAARVILLEQLILLGRIGEAKKEGQGLVAASVKALGDRDNTTLSAKASLADALDRSGDVAGGEAMLRAVVDQIRSGARVDGAVHMKALSGLALCVQHAGRREEAIALDRELLDSSAKIEGAEAPETLNSRNTLATALAESGRLDEAESLYAENLPIQRRTLGPDHPDTLQTLLNLGSLTFEKKRPAEAEALFRQVLAGAERSFPAGHPQIEIARSNLGQSLTAEGKCREAIPLLEVAQAGLQESQGIHNAWTQDTTSGLAEAYEACGRKTDAARLRGLLDPAPGG
jgi:non-specific serine/threonine protein kinase/serine/threonine-protein kinase